MVEGFIGIDDFKCVENRGRIVHGAVDLPGGDIARIGSHQLRHGAVGLGKGCEDMHTGEHSRVGEEKFLEIKMTRVFAAEDGSGTRHFSLDQRMADRRTHGNAAVLGDDLRHRLRGDHVVKDRGAGVEAQIAARDEGRDRRRCDDFAVLVDDEATVGIAIESQTDIGSLGDDGRLQVDQSCHIERVGLVVGKGSVEFEIERHQFDVHSAENRRDGVSGHAVTGVGDDLEPATVPERCEFAESIGVSAQCVCGLEDADEFTTTFAVEEFGGRFGDSAESAVQTDGPGARPTHLEAVVTGRIVTRSDHDAGDVPLPRGEVQQVGRRQADIDDTAALGADAVPDRPGDLRRRFSHVPADGRTAPAITDSGFVCERLSKGISERGIELFGRAAADVVGLDHRLKAWVHQRSLSVLSKRKYGWEESSGGGGWEMSGRPASRTASARASKSSCEGSSVDGSGASRRTVQPRGADKRWEWAAQRS